ncbi:MAG: hypothetical protein ACTSRU_06775 [Candidatus Hodarchaeales archaeon]
MTENNKPLLYIAVLVFSFLGVVLALTVVPEIITMLSSSGLDLSPLSLALSGIVIALVTYYGIGWATSTGEPTGMISLTFILFWIMAAVGSMLGAIAVELLTNAAVVLNLDLIITSTITGLPYALVPALAAILSLSTKSKD